MKREKVIYSEKHGARIEILSPIKMGCAKVRVLDSGKYLMARKGSVIPDFAVTFGILRFSQEK